MPRQKTSTRLAAVALIACAGACLQGNGPGPLPDPGILFIGNSLTSVNELPRLVERVAAAAGRKLTTSTVAFNDFSLEDHWQQGDAQRAIASRRWDTVVLQQGPSALPESRVLLVDWTKKFDEIIRRAGARTALYMVWPAESRFSDFDRVSESYALAASSVNGVLLPVGDAWRAVWRDKPGYPLYGPDRFHPSLVATYLAAIVIVDRLLGVAPDAGELRSDAARAGITPDDVKILLAASAATRGSSR